MTEALWNAVRRHARDADPRAVTRHGTVTSFDPATHAVKVMLQPDGTLTGWIPYRSAWVGDGWGLVLAPVIGATVQVDFQEADGGVGSAATAFFSDVDRPPQAPSGEAWLVHASGASIKLTNDGALTLDTSQGATVTLKGGQVASKGTWTHQGDLTVTGGDVKADGVSLKTHVHDKVQAGMAVSGKPVAG